MNIRSNDYDARQERLARQEELAKALIAKVLEDGRWEAMKAMQGMQAEGMTRHRLQAAVTDMFSDFAADAHYRIGKACEPEQDEAYAQYELQLNREQTDARV